MSTEKLVQASAVRQMFDDWRRRIREPENFGHHTGVAFVMALDALPAMTPPTCSTCLFWKQPTLALDGLGSCRHDVRHIGDATYRDFVCNLHQPVAPRADTGHA